MSSKLTKTAEAVEHIAEGNSSGWMERMAKGTKAKLLESLLVGATALTPGAAVEAQGFGNLARKEASTPCEGNALERTLCAKKKIEQSAADANNAHAPEAALPPARAAGAAGGNPFSGQSGSAIAPMASSAIRDILPGFSKVPQGAIVADLTNGPGKDAESLELAQITAQISSPQGLQANINPKVREGVYGPLKAFLAKPRSTQHQAQIIGETLFHLKSSGALGENGKVLALDEVFDNAKPTKVYLTPELFDILVGAKPSAAKNSFSPIGAPSAMEVLYSAHIIKEGKTIERALTFPEMLGAEIAIKKEGKMTVAGTGFNASSVKASMNSNGWSYAASSVRNNQAGAYQITYQGKPVFDIGEVKLALQSNNTQLGFIAR